MNVLDLVRKMTAADPTAVRALEIEIDSVLGKRVWFPQEGPQMAAYFSEADELFYGGSAGGGKALDINTWLPTPAGGSLMRDIQVGDALYNERGQPCRVTATSPVMIGRPCFLVRFSDGAELVADGDHRWYTLTDAERTAEARHDAEWRARRRANRGSRGMGKRPDLAMMNASRPIEARVFGAVRTTIEIAETLTVSGRLNHAVPLADALSAPDADLDVDPYLMGAWLGDGTSSGARITIAEPEVHELVTAAAAKHGWLVTTGATRYDYGIVGGLKVALSAAGLLRAKRIPEPYLLAGEAQRVALLQGLMDTDGYVDDRGQCEYTTTSRRLADGALRLIRSLGCKANICVGVATLNGRIIGDKYRIKFVATFPAFRLQRKAKLQKFPKKRSTSRRRYIVSVEPVESRPVKCVAIDSPSRLYLAGEHLVPTHNTDLLLGLASTAHTRSLILRREGTDLGAIEERLLALWKTRDGYNGTSKIMRRDGRFVELGSCPHEKDKWGYQGQAHDLKAFDEITQFSRAIFRYVIGWNRSTAPKQRCRVVCAGNPPATPEGEWVKHYWGPWLDPGHRNPAKPGELRWFTTTDDDEDLEVSADWRGRDSEGNEIRPVSRTFIPARLSDNAYLGADYRARLASMPEPYRTQLLEGSFSAGVKDHPRQVIPTKWVDLAQDRWRRRKELLDAGQQRKWVMTALGCDPALGGADEFVLAPLYDNITVGELICTPGKDITSGPVGAGLVIQHHRDKARLVVDMGGGYGDAVMSHIADKLPLPPLLYKGGGGSSAKAIHSGLYFANRRAEAYWRLREALDPDNPGNGGAEIALPPDDRLKADLVAPTFEVRGDTIHVEPKDKLCARIGRSPDRADAVVMAIYAPPLSQDDIRKLEANKKGVGRIRPTVILGHASSKKG